MLLVYDKERQPYGQGIVDNEATATSVFVGVGKASAGGTAIHPSEAPAWENMINRLLYVFVYVAGAWSSDAAWDEEDDGLVFNPQPPLTGPVSFLVGDASVRISHDMVINSDGKISHNLWLFCILIALFAARSHFQASFGELIERGERGPEAITWLTEFKARLINVQGYVERLRHIHDSDGDSVEREMEGGGGNHGSTSPPLPHLVPLSLELDYDTESAQPATTARAEPRPPIETGCILTSITAPSGEEPKVLLGQPLETGPQDRNMRTSFSSIPSSVPPKLPSIACRPMLQASGESDQETFPSSMSTYVDRRTGYSLQRDRSPSAEKERPFKRIRRPCSDPVVANRESGRTDRLGEGDSREVLDGSDEDEETRRLALLLARIVVGLCHGRYRPPTVSKEHRGVGKTAAELGDMLDVSVFFRMHSFIRLVCLLLLWLNPRWVDPDCPSSG